MPTPYGWIITKDNIDDGKSLGTIGPNTITHDVLFRLKAGEGTPFRLFDDDGEHYYSGLLLGDETSGFEPLDDFGMPNAGCTEIQFQNATTNAWEPL